MGDVEWGVQRPGLPAQSMTSQAAAVKFVEWYNTRRPPQFWAVVKRRQVSEWESA